MSLTTKRRARRALAYVVSCCLLLALPVASCSDRGITEPSSRLSPSGGGFSAAISLNTKVVYLGAPNSQPINFIRARVYDENGATIGSVDQNLDPTKNAFDFSLSVQLPGARAAKTHMTLELANRSAGGEIVQYSGRVMSLPLAPGDFRQVDIDLYPGPLDNFDVRSVRIVKPIRDIIEGDSVVATATVEGGTANTRIIWSSLDAAIATIDNGGKIRGVSAGVARVVAAVGTLADTASVKVNAKRAGLIVTPDVLEVAKIGDIGTYTAKVIDKNGAPIANEPVLWSIADPSIGSFVSTATVQGMRVGQTMVTARAANDTSLRGTAIFRVKPADTRVARLDVSPATATLRAIGATQTFVAIARDSAGTVLPNVSVSWASGTSSVATISLNGVATAAARGTTSITATADGISGQASLEVIPSASDLKLVGGDAQTDTVGRTLQQAFAVRTVDRAGNAVAGVPVQFTAADGATISVATATSNSEGVAQTQVTLGHTPGAYHVSARADSLAGSPITITANAVNGAPYAIEIERQPSSPAQNRATLTTQPIVRVVDIYGNRALHATPLITATADSGSIDGNTTAVNAATGLATYSTMSLGGRVGDRNITFASGSLRPATARVTLIAGPPASIVAVSGATQIGQAGAAVATVPSVRVVDVDGNPVAGATITFAVTTGSGSIVNVTATTDANGTASVGGWTLGTTAGTNTLTATVGALTTTFTATGTAGAPSSTGSTMTVSATTITAGAATPDTVTIRLRDGNGNPLTTSGGTVTIASTLGTVSSVVDNHDGSYTATLTAPQTVGTALITATLAGQSLTASATVTIAPGAPSATTTTVSVGSTSLNSNGTTTITVTVRDAYGNIVTNVTPGDLGLSSSIGTIGTVTCVNGVCTATYTAPGSNGNASISVSVGGSPVTTAPSIAVAAVASAVTGLTATRGNAQVSLSWTAPASNGSAITDYFIEYKPTAGSTWSAFSHTASTATSIVVTGLANGTSYDFRVSAVNGVGTGAASSIATATPATTAGAPTALAATAGASQVSLTWTAPNNGGSPITDYVIEYSTDGSTWTTFTHSASAATNIIVTGLTNGTAYHFRVSAVNAVGTSAPSSSANATPTLGGTPQLSVNGGNNQTATSGSAVATAPAVKALDANNNPVQGVSVTFTVASGGGSVTGASATTDASGIATVGGWTLGTTAGANSLTASASGYTSATINATGTVGAASAATSTVSVSPTALTANGTSTSTITVRLKDANGNNLTTGGASVTFATPSGGSIGTVTDNNDGTYTATYTAGSTAGNVAIQPKLGGTNFTNTATIGLTVGAATQLAITTNASGAASGAAFTTQPVVQIRDASNNVITGSTANVTMSVSTNGVIVGTSTVAAINGVATFANVGISGTAGTSYTLTFASASLTSATQLITPTAGAAAQLAVVTAASGAVNGTAFTTQPVIEVQDSFGNRTASTTTVTVAASTGSTLGGTTSVAAVNGRATFSGVSITGTAGTAYTLTYTATSLTSATQSITPAVGSDTQLAITTNAAGAASAAAFTTQPVVEIRDALGTRTASTANVTMTVSAGGTVVGTSTVAAVGGVATFSNVGISGLVTGSPYTLTFASSGLTSTTQSIALTAGAPAKLTVITSAANAANGSAFTTQPVIEIQDAQGNRTNSAATVAIASSTGSTLTGTTSVSAVNGRATFSGIALGGTAGTSYTLTYTSSGLTQTTQTITPTAGAATQLAIGTNAAGAASGAAFTTQPVIEIHDASNNVVAASTASVTMTVSSNGTTVGTATVAAVNGIATFTDVGMSGTAGTSYTLTFASSGLTSVTQSITPTAGAPTQLSISTSAAGAASGAAFTTQPVVRIHDAFGNLVSSTASVAMTVSTGGTVVGTTTVAAVGGVATFSNVGISGLVTGSPYTLTFASSGFTSTTQSIALTAGAPAKLAIVTSAANATNGTAFTTQPVIEIQDAQGNRTTSTTSVAVGSSAGGTLSGTTSIAAVNGRATFTDVAISGTAGTAYTLTYTATSLTSVTQSITPTAGAATQLAITTNAAGAVSGAAFTTQPVVQIHDASNSVVTGSTANVTMTVSTGGTVLGTTTVAAVNGEATFSTAGISGLVSGSPYTLTFASSGLTSATQSIALTAGAAAKLAIITSAANATNGTAFTTQPVIEIQDAAGNRTTSTASVTVATSTGSTLSGTTTVAAVNGRATFSNVAISGTAGTAYTLTYAATSLTSTTQTITPTAGAATQLSISTNASGSASGAAFTTQPVVEIHDASNSVVTGSTANVTMSVSSNGVVVGTSTVAAINGVATFSDVGIAGTAGTSYTLTFGSSGLTSVTQLITPTVGAAAKLAVVTAASGAVNGTAFTTQPVIEVQDSFGNRTASTTSITVATSVGSTLSGTTSVAAVNGRATFSGVSITGTAGTAYTLTYSATSLTSATQSITPAIGADDHLTITTNAAGAASGAAFTTQPVVEIRDAVGTRTTSTANVTMTVSSGGTVVGTTTVAAVSGVATFSTAGISGLVTGSPYTLTFTSSSLTSATQPITLTAGAAAKLAVVTSAANATNGTAFTTQPVIEIQDAEGNRTTSTATVSVASSAGGTLSGTTSVAAVNGRATFTDVAISGTAGTAYTLTYAATSLTSTTQTITPTAGTATQLSISTNAAGAVSGAAFTTQPVVEIHDATNSVVTGSTANVTMSVSSNGVVVGTSTVAAINGVATFSTVGIAGTAGTSYTLTFASAGLTSTTQLITPTVGAAAKLAVITAAASATNGVAFGTQPVIEIQDSFGNRTANTTTVTVATSVGSTLAGTTSVAAVNGRATFSGVSITGNAGTAYTLTYSAPSLTSTTQSITPAIGADDHLTITTNAAGAASGAAFTTQPVVEIRDAVGTRTTSTANVTMTVSTGGTVVGMTTVAAVSGVATFSTAGISGLVSGSPYTLTFASSGLTSATQSIALAAGAPAQLAVITTAAGAASGTAFTTQPVIEIQDAEGNRTNSTATVAVGTSAGSTLGGTTSVAAVNGRATFTDVAISGTAGTAYTLTYTATSLTSTTQTITPSVGTATKLALSTNASGAVSGAAFTTQPVVQIRDASSNVLTSSTASVTMSVSSNGVVVGTSTVAAINGVATFSDVGIAGTAGTSYTLTFATAGLTSATQLITPTAGAAAKLAIVTSAASATNGSAFGTQPVIEVQDSFGNRTASTTTVTIATSAGSTLGGTTSVAAVNGRATFSGVSITGTAGTAYTLTYTATSLTSVTQSITPTVGADDHLTITMDAAGAASGAAFTTQPVVEIRDAVGTRTTSTANVTMTVSTGGTVLGTTTVAAVSGVATFSNAGISGLVSGSPYTLTFASAGLTSATQPITLTAGAPAKLVVITTAAGAASGTAFTTQPVIEIQDAAGNRTTSTATVSIGTSAGSTLGGTTSVAAVNGRATFTDVAISGTAGTAYTLTYTATSLTSTTQTITPSAGTPTQLALSTNASGAVSGAAFTTQPVVQIRDANNNVITNSTANVTMSVSSNGVVVGTATVAAVNGVATFTNVGISGTAGTSYTLTFASATLTSATQLITPTAGAASQLSIVTSAAGASNGAAFATQPVIELQDAFGNRTTSTASVTVGVSIGGTTVGTVTVAAVNGRATFTNAGITGTAGTNYTLTYSAPSVTSVTQSITASAGADNQLALTTNAAGAASGAAFTTQPVVEIRDASGSRTASTASVTMTVSSGGTVLGTTTVAAVAGVATFSNVGISGLVSGSPYTLTFASAGLTSATQSIALTAGAASKLAVITQAAAVVSGSAFGTQPVIEIQDAAGNRTTSTANVAIATSAGSTLGGTTTVAAVNGRATFSGVTLTGTTGTSYTLTYSSSGLTSATQTIVPTGTPTKLLISTNAAGAAAGLAFTTQPVITIADASNQQTNSTAAVTMTVSAGGTVVGTSTVNAVAGVATFSDVGIGGTVGTYTLTFSSSPLTQATQSITLTYGTASQLFLLTAAAADSNGKKANTQPVIQVKDAYGNVRTGDNTTQVTASVDSAAYIVGTGTKTAASGVATYTDFGILGLAGRTYTITYASSGLTSVTQTLVTIATNSAQIRATSCTQTNSPTGNSNKTMPLPVCAQAQTGDVLVALVATTNVNATSIVAPAGWVQQGAYQTNAGKIIGAVFTKTATSTDANTTATFDFGSTNPGKVGGVISVFKNVVVDVASNGSNGLSTTPTDAVTTTASATPTAATVVFLVGLDPAGSLTPNASSTYFFENLTAVNGASGSKTGMFSRDGVAAGVTSTGTATSTSNSWAAFSIALKWTQVP